jgi:hypothetical protein
VTPTRCIRSMHRSAGSKEATIVQIHYSKVSVYRCLHRQSCRCIGAGFGSHGVSVEVNLHCCWESMLRQQCAPFRATVWMFALLCWLCVHVLWVYSTVFAQRISLSMMRAYASGVGRSSTMFPDQRGELCSQCCQRILHRLHTCARSGCSCRRASCRIKCFDSNRPHVSRQASQQRHVMQTFTEDPRFTPQNLELQTTCIAHPCRQSIGLHSRYCNSRIHMHTCCDAFLHVVSLRPPPPAELLRKRRLR